jgi:hypothetical protein
MAQGCAREADTNGSVRLCGKVCRMKRILMIIGVVIILLGIAAVLHPTYHQQQQVAKVGPFQATVDEEKTAQIPVAATVAALVAGLALVLIGARMKT